MPRRNNRNAKFRRLDFSSSSTMRPRQEGIILQTARQLRGHLRRLNEAKRELDLAFRSEHKILEYQRREAEKKQQFALLARRPLRQPTLTPFNKQQTPKSQRSLPIASSTFLPPPSPGTVLTPLAQSGASTLVPLLLASSLIAAGMPGRPLRPLAPIPLDSCANGTWHSRLHIIYSCRERSSALKEIVPIACDLDGSSAVKAVGDDEDNRRALIMPGKEMDVGDGFIYRCEYESRKAPVTLSLRAIACSLDGHKIRPDSSLRRPPGTLLSCYRDPDAVMRLRVQQPVHSHCTADGDPRACDVGFSVHVLTSLFSIGQQYAFNPITNRPRIESGRASILLAPRPPITKGTGDDVEDEEGYDVGSTRSGKSSTTTSTTTTTEKSTTTESLDLLPGDEEIAGFPLYPRDDDRLDEDEDLAEYKSSRRKPPSRRSHRLSEILDRGGEIEDDEENEEPTNLERGDEIEERPSRRRQRVNRRN